MAKSNMGVADQEFTSAGNAIGLYAAELVAMIDRYNSAVKIICENGIQDQLVRSRLSDLAGRVAGLREPLKEISKKAAEDCKGFVDEIDNADKFLY